MNRFNQRVSDLLKLADSLPRFERQLQIVPCNGGYEVQESYMTLTGETKWQRATWCSNMAAAERAVALRMK